VKTENPYRTISLRRELTNEIEDYIKIDKRYSTITDFIIEAVRLRLNQLQQIMAKGAVD